MFLKGRRFVRNVIKKYKVGKVVKIYRYVERKIWMNLYFNYFSEVEYIIWMSLKVEMYLCRVFLVCIRVIVDVNSRYCYLIVEIMSYILGK